MLNPKGQKYDGKISSFKFRWFMACVNKNLVLKFKDINPNKGAKTYGRYK